MIKGIIDRFEDDLVAVEIEGEIKIVRRIDLPSEVRKGDAVVFFRNCWTIEKNDTKKPSISTNRLTGKLCSDQ
ncbi:MAG TPA: DUF3006 domain-containing protein [Syntrophomonadaceae bacterium]|nr:DUF3006 domain-containing protein [Syntrophomonadaceae bacterium]